MNIRSSAGGCVPAGWLVFGALVVWSGVLIWAVLVAIVAAIKGVGI